MNAVITQEGLDILNNILPKIDPHANTFTIEDLYSFFLKEKFPTTVDGVRTGLYDKAFADLRERRIFVNLGKWLTQNGFAEVVPMSSPFIHLKLTNLGDVLWAYGSFDKYMNSNQINSPILVFARIDEIIKTTAYRYGEFRIIQSPKIVRVLNMEILSPDDVKVRDKILEIIKGKTDLIETHEQRKIDEEAIGYLIAEGFAENRHDIKDGHETIYRQLTDRGRKLKELGTIELFNKWEEEEKKQERIKIETEREFIQKQNEFIDISKAFTEKQTEAIQSQIETNELAKITNVYIAVFTGLGGLYALLQLLITLIPERTPNRNIIIYFIMAFALLAGIIGYRRIALINRRSKNLKQQ